jgi:hypothetical protein
LPITSVLVESTTVTEGNFPKLCVIVQLADAISKHCEYVPDAANTFSKSNIVHTLDGIVGQLILALVFTVANGSTNTPGVSVATTILVLAEFCQSHNSLLVIAFSKSS